MNVQATSRLNRGAALLIGLAGLIHLVITPQHWAHSPAHGLLFAVVGVVEVVWAVMAWRRPSVRLYSVGLVLAVALVVLWTITRVLPAPFGHGGPEPVEPYGIVCKLAETLGAIVLGILVFGQIATTNASAARRAVALWVIAAVVLGFATYGVARAAEPFLPALGAPAEHHHEHEEGMPSGEHQHEEAAPTHEHEEVTPAHEHEEVTPTHEHQH